MRRLPKLETWRNGWVWHGLLVAAAVVLSLLAGLSARLPGDLALTSLLQSFHPSWLDTVMWSLTWLADTPVAAGTLLLAAGVLALLRRWKEGALFASVMLLDGVLELLKEVVARPRPPEELVRILDGGSSGSFPSAHVFHTVVLAGLLWELWTPGVRRRRMRVAARGVLIGAVVLMGASRVYLGAHWPSDVAGGILWGVLAVVFLLSLAKLWQRWRALRPKPSGKG